MQLKFSRDIEWNDLPRIESPFFARAHVERGFYSDPYGMDAVAGIDDVIRDGIPGHFGRRRDAAALDWLLRRVENGEVVLVHLHGRRPFQPVLRWEEDLRAVQARHGGGVSHLNAFLSGPGGSNDGETASRTLTPPSPPQGSGSANDDDAGHWTVDPYLSSSIRLPVERWLQRARTDPQLNRGLPEIAWWGVHIGGARHAMAAPLAEPGQGPRNPFGLDWSQGEQVACRGGSPVQCFQQMGGGGGGGPVGRASRSPAAAATPQVFRNRAPTEEIVPAVLFSPSQIQKVGYSGRLNYVVTQSGELIIGRTGHISLSRGADVLAAGEARFVRGNLRSIDNASGHYRPSGPTAQNAAEAAFCRAGFETTGKYIERSF